MTFLNPWGLLALISIPILIILYILKQRHNEYTVPSLFLWRQTETFVQASSPWQKLKNSLLFILQLLMLLFIALAISRPIVMSKSGPEDIIIIIDSSASMQAKDQSPSRFEYAKKEVRKLINGLAPKQKMTLIEAGENPSLLVSRSDNKQGLRDSLNSLAVSFSVADIESAYNLAESILKESSKGQIIIYSDKDYDNSGNIKIVNLTKDRDNIGISHVSSTLAEDGYILMSTIANYGEAKEVTLELYESDRLIDAKKVAFEKDEIKPVYWKKISKDYKLVQVRIANKDILDLDNEVDVILSQSIKQKVLIVSDESFFLEKVIAAIGDYDIYKTTKEKASMQKGFDLYVYDGYVPDKVQEDGNIWLINPDKDYLGLALKDGLKGTKLTSTDSLMGKSLSAYIKAENIYLARFKEAKPTDDWDIAFKCGQLPAILTKVEGIQRHLVLMFSIEESNLPLLKEFPILIQNMLSITLPSLIEGDGNYIVGQMLEVKGMINAEKIYLSDPSGKEIILAPPFPAQVYTIDKKGLYVLVQKLRQDGGLVDVKSYFAARIAESESTMDQKGINIDDSKIETKEIKAALEMWPYLLALAILAGLLEWWVYYRGNKF